MVTSFIVFFLSLTVHIHGWIIPMGKHLQKSLDFSQIFLLRISSASCQDLDWNNHREKDQCACCSGWMCEQRWFKFHHHALPQCKPTGTGFSASHWWEFHINTAHMSLCRCHWQHWMHDGKHYETTLGPSGVQSADGMNHRYEYNWNTMNESCERAYTGNNGSKWLTLRTVGKGLV